jgi:glycosyltransferase involved in cell wall biosynthesis
MRFLMLNWRDPRNPRAGGAERVALGYLSALAARGHAVYWCTHDFAGADPTECIDGVRVVRAGGFLTSVLEAYAWYRFQDPFDLVIDQHHGIPWYAPWWCQTRCVGYMHEVLGPIWNSFYPWPISRFGQLQERWTLYQYRHVPFITGAPSAQRMLRSLGIRHVTVLPNGVHTRPLPSLDDKPLNSPLRLVAVCRLAPNKRLDHALRLMEELRRRGIDARMTIVGTGEAEASLHRLTARLGLASQVQFTGPLPEADKDQALREAHFLVHTSQREGWGLNVIEANAMGTPALVYPVTGLVDSTVANVTGLIAAQETPIALADSLGRLLGKPELYRTMRFQAWKRAEEFHWDVLLPKGCARFEAFARGEVPPPGAE